MREDRQLYMKEVKHKNAQIFEDMDDDLDDFQYLGSEDKGQETSKRH